MEDMGIGIYVHLPPDALAYVNNHLTFHNGAGRPIGSDSDHSW
jgi:hypothetical protein